MNKKLPKLNLSKSQKTYSAFTLSPVSKIKSIISNSKQLVTPQKSFKAHESSPCVSEVSKRNPSRASLIKNKALLNEMGFRSELDFKPINLCEGFKEAGQLYSIQVVDFWGSKEKLKFLKEQGYWEAYKDMISESKKSKLYHSKTFKQPIDAKVLDISYKVKNAAEISFSSSFNHKIDLPITRSDSSIRNTESSDMLEKLETIENKCFKLVNDTKLLKKDENEFRSEISRKLNFTDIKKKKLRRHEISNIQQKMNSFR